MKKRIIAFFAAILIALPMVTATASAAEIQPRWSLINSMNAWCSMEGNAYIGSVTASNTVYKMDISIVLYEKGLFTGYKEVSRISKTVYDFSHTASSAYTYSSTKDYKVEITVKAYTSSGQTETVTVYNEYT